MRVLIIGGGIGGLTLAHGLHKNGIDVKVFEQHTKRAENLAGYGLHIDPKGRQALRSCLPLSNWKRLQPLFSSAGTQLFFRDTQLRVLAEKNDSIISGKPSSEVELSGVGRLDLRDALLDGLDDPTAGIVKWGSVFTKYERLSDGRVRAYFANGTHEDGDLLVGSDGPNSLVRHQLMPELQRVELGVSTIVGRYVLDEKRIANLPADLTSGVLNNIVPWGKGWMFTCAWRSRPAASGEFDEPEHYVVWAYVIPSKETADMTSGHNTNGAVLRDIALKGMKSWSPSLQELVNGTEASTIKCLSLRSMPQLTSWQPSNVTLLGDAIHNMTPMAGMGANTALRDAELLTRCLVDVMAARLCLIDAIGIYEDHMRVYANAAVKLSTQNARNACFGAGLQRLLFRGFLCAAQSCPPIMRATLGRSVGS